MTAQHNTGLELRLLALIAADASQTTTACRMSVHERLIELAECMVETSRLPAEASHVIENRRRIYEEELAELEGSR